MQDIKVEAVAGGAHITIPRDLNEALKTAFPRARWVAATQTWAIAGVTAERRAHRWVAVMRAEADKVNEEAQAAAESAGVTVTLDGRAYFDALKADGSRMSTPNVRIKVVEDHVRVACAYHETIPPALRKLGGRWDATARVWIVPIAKARQLHATVDAAEAVLASTVALEAPRKAARQAEWDRQRAVEVQALDEARRAEQASSEWWIVGTEPALGRPFEHRGHRVVAVGHGERRRIDTDAIGVNGGSHDLNVHSCVRVRLRDATAEDEAAEMARRSAAAAQHRAAEEARQRRAAERRAEAERIADTIEAGEARTVTTTSGTTAVIGAAYPGDGRALVTARVARDGTSVYDGEVGLPYPIVTTPGARERHAALLSAGSTHYARLGDWGVLGLDAAGTALLERIHEAHEIVARRRKETADAAHGAAVRASGADVRLVLTDDWAGHVEIAEAWVPATGWHVGYDESIRMQMRDVRPVVIAPRCPSLNIVARRGKVWGMMPGSGTHVWVISPEDRELLIRESRAIEAIRAAQDAPTWTRPLTPDDLRAVEQIGREIAYEAMAEEVR